MRGLIEAGVDIDVFVIYPHDPSLWRYVPETLSEKVLPRSRVHYLKISECIGFDRSMDWENAGRFLRDALSITAAATRHGIGSFAKTSYLLPKAWTWAERYGASAFDHVLAYWGNYTATCAYLFHRIASRPIPFSVFLHAGPDLYREHVYMREKLLYADNIVTCSDFNRNFIETRFPDIADKLSEKVHVHRHGLDLAEFTFNSNGRSPLRVIGVGRIEKEKGYDFLIRAVHRLAQRNCIFRTEIVGDGGQLGHLKTLANELGVGERVAFRGWLTPSETKEAIRQASILVHPAAELGDGVPNVIKESMALGTPVIASAIAGIPELLQNGRHGILVRPRDVEALAEAIEKLLHNTDTRCSYAKSARNYVELNFDLQRNGQELRAVLERSASRNGAAIKTCAI
jgi:glycosyltransferase involved in cell wall biosynthesis